MGCSLLRLRQRASRPTARQPWRSQMHMRWALVLRCRPNTYAAPRLGTGNMNSSCRKTNTAATLHVQVSRNYMAIYLTEIPVVYERITAATCTRATTTANATKNDVATIRCSSGAPMLALYYLQRFVHAPAQHKSGQQKHGTRTCTYQGQGQYLGTRRNGNETRQRLGVYIVASYHRMSYTKLPSLQYPIDATHWDVFACICFCCFNSNSNSTPSTGGPKLPNGERQCDLAAGAGPSVSPAS